MSCTQQSHHSSCSLPLLHNRAVNSLVYHCHHQFWGDLSSCSSCPLLIFNFNLCTGPLIKEGLGNHLSFDLSYLSLLCSALCLMVELFVLVTVIRNWNFIYFNLNFQFRTHFPLKLVKRICQTLHIFHWTAEACFRPRRANLMEETDCFFFLTIIGHL